MGGGEFEQLEEAQVDDSCKVMMYFIKLVTAIQEGKPVPDPDPNCKETAWWYKEIVSNQNIQAVSVWGYF